MRIILFILLLIPVNLLATEKEPLSVYQCTYWRYGEGTIQLRAIRNITLFDMDGDGEYDWMLVVVDSGPPIYQSRIEFDGPLSIVSGTTNGLSADSGLEGDSGPCGQEVYGDADFIFTTPTGLPVGHMWSSCEDNFYFEEITGPNNTSGIMEKLDKSTRISPNPIQNSELTIKFESEVNLSDIQIFDIRGTCYTVKVDYIEPHNISIDVSSLSDGYYTIKYISKTQVYYDNFLIKR